MEDNNKCSCGRCEAYAQYDHYGIYAGKMCDLCFKEKFKQGAYYDYFEAGEYLEPEDF